MTPRLSEADRRRIEAAIAEIERHSAAEIAVAVTGASDDYAGATALWAGGAALVGGAIAAALLPGLTAGQLALGQAAALVALYAAFSLTGLGPRLAGRAAQDAATDRLAAAEFARLVEARTADRRGLLVMLSLAERRIEIVADRGIAARIDDDEWRKVVAEFAASARAHLGDSLLAALRRCGDLLAAHFPPEPGQRDELPNRIAES